MIDIAKKSASRQFGDLILILTVISELFMSVDRVEKDTYQICLERRVSIIEWKHHIH